MSTATLPKQLYKLQLSMHQLTWPGTGSEKLHTELHKLYHQNIEWEQVVNKPHNDSRAGATAATNGRGNLLPKRGSSCYLFPNWGSSCYLPQPPRQTVVDIIRTHMYYIYHSLPCMLIVPIYTPKGFPSVEMIQNSIFSCNNSIPHGSRPSVRFSNTKNLLLLSSVTTNSSPCTISHFER